MTDRLDLDYLEKLEEATNPDWNSIYDVGEEPENWNLIYAMRSVFPELLRRARLLDEAVALLEDRPIQPKCNEDPNCWECQVRRLTRIDKETQS